ncbi:MAG TPA: DUF1360 domain-containing protein [Acidimicrobiales bacterium]|nr:DUF1360 domain-containing protein [Acidimicrobiales bacterium]
MNPDEDDKYAEGKDDRPLRGYILLMSTYGAVVGALTLLLRRRKTLPQLGLGDLALIAVATHKLSRVVTKDSITSPLRAPFVTYVEPAGAGEVNEKVRVGGAAHAVGELLMCPLCVDVWVATGFVGASAFAPRATRMAASVFAIGAVSNALHFAWDALKKVDE